MKFPEEKVPAGLRRAVRLLLSRRLTAPRRGSLGRGLKRAALSGSHVFALYADQTWWSPATHVPATRRHRQDRFRALVEWTGRFYWPSTDRWDAALAGLRALNLLEKETVNQLYRWKRQEEAVAEAARNLEEAAALLRGAGYGVTPPKRKRLPVVPCAAGSDGDCRAADCPQNFDGEPAMTGRHCPRDVDRAEGE